MTTRHPLSATVLGYPRIGAKRELKRAVEAYWAGNIDDAGLAAASAEVRAQMLTDLSAQDLTSVPVNVFSHYDHVLDTTAAVGAIPERYRNVGGTLAQYFAAAHGNAELAPLELTKWFDTNYHYLVPELGPDTVFSAQPQKALQEYHEAVERGLQARPVLLGPISFLLLAKPEPGSPSDFHPLSRLEDLIACYRDLLAAFTEAGATWVQLDEPALCADRTEAELAAVATAYTALAHTEANIFVTGGYGSFDKALPLLLNSGIDALAIDAVAGASDIDWLEANEVPPQVTLVAGVVDGRNIWRTDTVRAAAIVDRIKAVATTVGVSSSCSLLHVPVDLEAETGLAPELAQRLAFARQKIREVSQLAQPDGERWSRGESNLAWRNDHIRQRLASLDASATQRDDFETRVKAQEAHTPLPPLATTSIGSFPQTTDIRRARAQHRNGLMIDVDYKSRLKKEIASVIELQERLDFDVLVHGEAERNDMVQYFAEHLAGFTTTEAGWVQSYGSRCVRPPILFGDVSRPSPITVDWSAYAQSLTTKPVKGMLTGPVTILAWSFVRDDQPLSDTAAQVALALRDEVADLEAAGLKVIQVDEPALREMLPLRQAEQDDYRRWATDAFRLATAVVKPETAIHTHLCYSEFGEVIDAINALDADVTSIEASRSKMEVLQDLHASQFARGVGPGVYDIHSPRVPTVEEIASALSKAIAVIDPKRLWVNPDCGLKTRRYKEVEPALASLVEAAKQVRAQL
ncbi:5-methyltetrahydropteroyltriglutamate--homocysteine S-methyltransferase [Natronoglycomyces albus]|uniref:5-methyltetrahydropteroyltriglutamate--homocysteine S-methyltransferase n=1 Tax=Natronoglycomyces albus TaxID=2811108 RepID=A0A895XSF1_9ACTN|nr:5-methyltetrahydropteroyltriglutamate--homocysteine S-methyltransferase [Natronoglycomyces albus]QSB06155.1 5-methyltetrahydropteroyltriglutamate--homocysteine S-methyltransferase [Natronoglycomyces albus]